MLVDIDIDMIEKHPFFGKYLPVKESDTIGVYRGYALANTLDACGYETKHFPSMHIKGREDFKFFGDWMCDDKRTVVYRSCFGVADNIQQVLELYRDLYEVPDRQFVLSYYHITRKDDAGWKWHKNGAYIGIQKPTREYIGDEVEIEAVISFCFIEIFGTKGIKEKGAD